MAEKSTVSHFCIRSISRSIIKAPANLQQQPYMLPVSNFDHLSGRYPVTLFYAYRKPPFGDFSSVMAGIRTSLSDILVFFPPFAGRVVQKSESSEVEILCNNQGAELIEALADVSLASLDLYDLDSSVKKLMLPIDCEIPLSLQVTGYTCGGFSLAWSFDHVIADGAGFVRFLSCWAEMARTKKISSVPNHDRSLFRPRSPPTYGPSLDQIFTSCTLDEVRACPTRGVIKRLYYVEGSSIDRLKAISSEGGERTRTEALSAYILKTLARSLDDAENCKMGWLVDGRARVDMVDPESMSNYVGNLVSMAVAEASVRELKEASMSQVAGMASRAIQETANATHFMELNDWIEGQRPKMVLANILLGLGEPAVVVSSMHDMPVMATDFGFGPPLVTTFHSLLEGLGAGYMGLFSSGKEDGSWFVFAFVWPRLAAEMELDPDRIFRPITWTHIGL